MSERTLNIQFRKVIGSGGMADVGLFQDQTLERPVAVKILRSKDKDKIRRFENEAKISASLHQENLPVIYDYKQDQERHWLLMEYVEGIDISEIMRKPNHQKIPPLVAAMIMRELARALEYLHEQTIIHRDIKPSNVRLSSDGQIKLMDLGIAKDETSKESFTSTGVIIGTPSYMSPEQASGDKVSFQSDLFSLGTLIYEMVTGVKPFAADSNLNVISLIAQCRFKPVDRMNPAVPRELVHIIHRAMTKNLTHRYQTAGEIIRDINLFLQSISQIEIKKFLKNYYELVMAPYAPDKFKQFFLLPQMAFSQTSSMMSPAPKPGIIRRLLTNTRVMIGIIGIAGFIIGLAFPAIKQLLLPAQRFGSDPYGSLELALTTADNHRLASAKIWINEKEYPLPDFFDGSIGLHYFSPGWNSLRIRYPAYFQMIDYRFYLNNFSDKRALKLNLDKLIREQDQPRFDAKRYGFTVITDPKDAKIILNNDNRNPFARTPYINSWPVFKSSEQMISVEKDGFIPYQTKYRFSGDEFYYLKIDLQDQESGRK